MSSVPDPALKRRRIKIVAAAVGILALFGLVAYFGGGTWWKETVDTLSPAWLLVCFALLPLAGFPMSLLLIAVGARFGFWPGFGFTAVITAFHLVTSYPLAGLVRRPVMAILDKAGWSLPKLTPRTAWPFATWLALAPGVSYAIKAYTPSLAGIPFTTFFVCYFPINMSTAVLGLLLGGATTHFSWPIAGVVVVYAIVILTLTKLIAARLREQGAFKKDAQISPPADECARTA